MIYNINCTKIVNKLSIPEYTYQPGNSCFFHCITTGHYWRNSTITELSLLYEESDGMCKKECWLLEKECDEYDMLAGFTKSLGAFSSIIGFNSSSFHIPYLENKLKAYGLPSPFSDREHIDLQKKIKPIGQHLHISTRLNDLRIFLKLPDVFSEIECIASAPALFRYEEILKGNFSVEKAERLGDELLIFCKTALAIPADIRLHNDQFYLIGSGYDIKIKIKLIQNRVKLYYNNYKDYYYLPESDIVVHKSLAAAIPKEKKVKATAQNCFSLVETDKLLSNPSAMKKYLVALFEHYMNTKGNT